MDIGFNNEGDQGLTGVILLAFGGADSMEAVEPFMKNLMGGRPPAPALVEKIKARYELIGGRSPLPDITAAQAAKLEEYLRAAGSDQPATGKGFLVEVGMRYWHPFIKEGLDRLLEEGADTVVAVSLAPFYSRVSTGAYREELEKAAASRGDRKPRVIITGPLYNNPKFLEAVTEKVRDGLAGFDESRRKSVPVIFSAHSLPVAHIRDGDPYVEQFEFTVEHVVRMLGLKNWHRAYQSKGGGQGEWLGPMVEEVMDDLKKRGSRDVLVAPVGFVSDHIETLYDIDIAQKKHAGSLGLNFHRTASLNTSELFIRALEEIVRQGLKEIV